MDKIIAAGISGIVSLIVAVFSLLIAPYIKNYIERRRMAYNDFYKKLCRIDFVATQVKRSMGWDINGLYKNIGINDAAKEIDGINLKIIERKYFFEYYFGKKMSKMLNEYIKNINLAFLKGKEDFERGRDYISDQDDADNLYSSTIFYQHNAAKETLKAIDLARNKKSL